MKKGVNFIFLVSVIFLLTFVSADVDDEMKKLAHYAKEYDIGNINWAKFSVYSSSVREKINEEVGAVDRDEGGRLKQDQIRKILGEPDGETRWAWVERENRERRLPEPVSTWQNKIIYDGGIIQVRLSAWPSIYVKAGSTSKDVEEIGDYDDFEDEDDGFFGDDDHDDFDERRDSGRERENREDRNYGEEQLVYYLNFDIEFKRPEDQLDVEGKIEEIKTLAENFNLDPSRDNAEKLARESVNAEMAFENNFRQGSLICEEIMNDIFGSENKRQTQKTIQQEIDFFPRR